MPDCGPLFHLSVSLLYVDNTNLSDILPPKADFFSLRVKRMEKIALSKILGSFGITVFLDVVQKDGMYNGWHI